MKRFAEEKGKKVVYVQVKDLRFLDSQSRTPQNVKNLIKLEHLNVNRQEDYFRFDDEEFVKYLNNANFIIDYDEFSNLSDKYIREGFNINYQNIISLSDEIRADEKKKKDVKAKKENLNELKHYAQSIADFIDYERSKGRTL